MSVDIYLTVTYPPARVKPDLHEFSFMVSQLIIKLLATLQWVCSDVMGVGASLGAFPSGIGEET